MNIDLTSIPEREKLDLLYKLRADLKPTLEKKVQATGKFKELASELTFTDYKTIKPDFIPKNIGDCAILTVSSMLDKPYEEVYKSLFNIAMNNYYMPNDVIRVIMPYVEQFGWNTMTTYSKTNRPMVGDIIARYRDRELIIGEFMYLGSSGHMFGYKNNTIYDHGTKRFEDATALNIQLECPVTFYIMKTKGL